MDLPYYASNHPNQTSCLFHVRWAASTVLVSSKVIPGADVMEKMGFKGEGLRKPTRRLAGLAAAFHVITLINLSISAPK